MKAKKEQTKDIYIISVTDITSKRTPKRKRYLVETNEDSYKFDEEIVVKYMLLKDHEFSKDEFNEVLHQAKVNEGLNKSLSYLARCKKSTYEVREYLRKKQEYSPSDIDCIINKLREYNYLSDFEFAKSYLETYGEVKGPRYIIQKLEEKRIHKDIINEVIKSYSDEFDKAFLLSLKIQESKDLSKYPILKQKNKIYTKLINDGFNNDSASYAISKLEFVDESDIELKKDIKKQLRKYIDSDLRESEIKNKIISSLMAKGYNYKNISKFYNEIKLEND